MIKIKKKEEIPGITYYTIEVTKANIPIQKILDLIDNADDYLSKDGFDKESFKEDVIGASEYLITAIGDVYTCTCKNCLFSKTECRHIAFVREHGDEYGN